MFKDPTFKHFQDTLDAEMKRLTGQGYRSNRSSSECIFRRRTTMEFTSASGNEPEKLIHTSFGEKNNLGGLKHRTFKRKRIEHYAKDTCLERCMVNLYKKYLKKCPPEAFDKDAFYVAPRRKYSDDDEGMWMIVVDMIFAFVVIRLITLFFYF